MCVWFSLHKGGLNGEEVIEIPTVWRIVKRANFLGKEASSDSPGESGDEGRRRASDEEGGSHVL